MAIINCQEYDVSVNACIFNSIIEFAQKTIIHYLFWQCKEKKEKIKLFEKAVGKSHIHHQIQLPFFIL